MPGSAGFLCTTTHHYFHDLRTNRLPMNTISPTDLEVARAHYPECAFTTPSPFMDLFSQNPRFIASGYLAQMIEGYIQTLYQDLNKLDFGIQTTKDALVGQDIAFRSAYPEVILNDETLDEQFPMRKIFRGEVRWLTWLRTICVSVIDTHRNFLCHFRALPVEIITKIFGFALGDAPVTINGDIRFSLAQVCQHWRAVITSHAGLWKTLNLGKGLGKYSDGAKVRLQSALEWSAPRGLDLTIALNDMHFDYIHTIVQSHARWGKVRIEGYCRSYEKVYFHSSFPECSKPLLQHLELVVDFGYVTSDGSNSESEEADEYLAVDWGAACALFQNSPRLKLLVLHERGDVDDAQVHSERASPDMFSLWPTVKMLVLVAVDPWVYYSSLEHCPSLDCLQIMQRKLYEDESEVPSWTSHRILLPSLKALITMNHCIAAALECPSLVHLGLRKCTYPRDIINFLTNSKCRITDFFWEVCKHAVIDESYAPLLPLLSSVGSLILARVAPLQIKSRTGLEDRLRGEMESYNILDAIALFCSQPPARAHPPLPNLLSFKLITIHGLLEHTEYYFQRPPLVRFLAEHPTLRRFILNCHGDTKTSGYVNVMNNILRYQKIVPGKLPQTVVDVIKGSELMRRIIALDRKGAEVRILKTEYDAVNGFGHPKDMRSVYLDDFTATDDD